MNSYNFVLNTNGFLLALAVIAMLLLSIYAYRRTIPAIPSFAKKILIALRWLGLSVLFFMLFEPALEMSTIEKIEPKTLVFIDNSKSIAMEREGINLKDRLFKSIEDANLPTNNIEFYNFSSEVLKVTRDSILELNLDGSITNFENVFDKISNVRASENIGSVVLFSDGNFNDGQNPIYSAGRLGVPVYTLTVGDTTEYSDVNIETLITNKIAYLNSAIPVNVILKSSNYDIDSVSVALTADGKVIDTKKIKLSKDKESYLLSFEYIPETEGAKALRVTVEDLPREINTKNNYKTEYIKVLDNKKKISLFAGAPSYDVSILSKILSADVNAKLSKFIQKKGSDFYNNPTDGDLKETQLFVFSGFPNKFTPNSLLEKIAQEIKKGKPYLLVFSRDLDFKKLRILGSALPFGVLSESNKEFQVLPVADKSNLSNLLLRISGSDSDLDLWNSLSPLYKTETFLKLEPGAKSVLSIAINNTVVNEPMLIQSESNGIKSVIIAAYGLNNWRLGSLSDKMLRDNEAIDLTQKLINNSLKWLSVKNEGRKFSVSTNKNSYISGEPVLINAQVYNDSYDALDEAEVKVELKSPNDEREIILSSIGSGRYTARVEGLASDNYVLNAVGKYRDKIIGRDQAKFNIGDLNIEYLKMNANLKLMEDLAKASGGESYFYTESQKLSDALSRNQPKAKEIVNEEVLNIWERPWLLILAISLFSIEWLIRKRLGML